MNKIEDEGAIALAEILQNNQSINILDLSWNKIGDEGAKAIGKSLARNHALTCLFLDSNHISDEGAKDIGEGLAQNKTLTDLHLLQNQIGVTGKIDIGRVLLYDNKTLVYISFEDWQNNDIDEITKLAQDWLLLKRNKTVKSACFAAKQEDGEIDNLSGKIINNENSGDSERATKVGKLLEGRDTSNGQCLFDSNDGEGSLAGDNTDQQ